MIEIDIRKRLQRIAIHTRKHYSHTLRDLNLHIGQEIALAHLWQQDGITQSTLRNKIGSEASTVSNMVRKLEQDGIVYRKTCPEDSRATIIFLTEKGKALQTPIEQMWRNHEQQLLDNLLDEEKMLLRRLLLQMEKNLLKDE